VRYKVTVSDVILTASEIMQDVRWAKLLDTFHLEAFLSKWWTIRLLMAVFGLEVCSVRLCDW
jgi:hypothetical protein